MKTLYNLARLILLVLTISDAAAQELIPGYGLKVMSTPYHAISADQEGNIFVYYHFDLVNGEYVGSLAKIDQNGQLAADFHKVYTDGVVGDVRVQADGKILMSGDYSKVNGQPSADLVRLNPDGSIDMSFSSAIQEVGSFDLQSDGKIVAFAPGLVRFNTDGSIDETFNAPSLNSKGILAVGPDDHIQVLGYSTVYRLKPDGEIDPDFFIGAGVNNNHISAIEIQSDGKILLGGFFTEYNGVPASSIVRLLADGSVDASFDAGIGPRGQVFQIVERVNRQILLGGQFTHYNDQQGNLVQLNADGSLDKIIAIVMPNNITYIAESANEKITIAGEFSLVNSTNRDYIVKFNPDHTIDAGFNPIVTYTNTNERFLEVNSKGEVFTGGFDGIYHGTSPVRQLIVKLDVFGRYTSSFSRDFPGQAPRIRSSCIQHDDKLLLSGFLQGHSGPTLMRLNPDASLDESFQIGTGPTTGTNSPALSEVIVQKDTLLYIGGQFEKFNGETANNLVVLHLDGSIHKTFPSMSISNQVFDIAFQSDGKMILIGSFDLPSGHSQIIRLNADGSIDETFSLTLSATLQLVRTDATDRIYLGGMIYTLDGALVNSLVRLLPDGNLDTSFDTGTGFHGNDWVTALEILPDGRLAVGGRFNGYHDQAVNGFIMLDESGNSIPTPLISFGTNSTAIDIKYHDEAIYLAGRFVKNDYSDVHGNVKIALKPLVIPEAPENLVVNLQSEGVFELQWDDISNNELLFILERATGNPAEFSVYDTLYANTSTASDSNIEGGQKYHYRIKAMNEAGESAWSNVAFETWIPVPAGEVNLTVTQDENAFFLSWESNATYLEGYIIERATDPHVGYEVLDTVSAETKTYVDVVENDIHYSYKVTAYNAAGKVVSNEITTIISGINSGEFSVSVYPIPAKITLYSKIRTQKTRGQWFLINTTGQIIRLHSEILGEVSAMDVQNVPPGMYAIQYAERGKVLMRSRVVIEH